jgi:DNA-binding CsgD family transcriptional regulator
VLLLAEAEVAVREGLDTEAQTIAEQAAELSLSSELAARAHLVAGRAAHMRRDDAAARENAQRAAALTNAPHVRADARWLEFVNAYETEDEGAREILELLRGECDGSPEQALRLRNATGCVALEMDGDVRQSLRLMEPGLALLDRVSNPLARTSFLNFMSTAYLYLCDYDRCLEVVDRHISDARASGLDFATDHALVIRASALIGQRRLGSAQRTLQELQSRSVRPSPHVVIEARMQASRLRAAAGDVERAEILLRGSIPEGVSKASHGEVIASRALYLSAMGDLPAARLAIREAAETSRYAKTRDLNELADAIASLQEASDAPFTARSSEVIVRTIQAGQLDSLVLACRVYPRLAKSAVMDETVARELTNILASSNDVDIGRSAGLTMPRELRRTAGLSKRELEVYELVAQGRSNREIAKALFISESTTKVHVRHIFEKLKVRTRAEAAAMAIRDER